MCSALSVHPAANHDVFYFNSPTTVQQVWSRKKTSPSSISVSELRNCSINWKAASHTAQPSNFDSITTSAKPSKQVCSMWNYRRVLYRRKNRVSIRHHNLRLKQKIAWNQRKQLNSRNNHTCQKICCTAIIARPMITQSTIAKNVRTRKSREPLQFLRENQMVLSARFVIQIRTRHLFAIKIRIIKKNKTKNMKRMQTLCWTSTVMTTAQTQPSFRFGSIRKTE